MTNPLHTDRLQRWGLGMAEHVATLSKDPSTKVGAVIFDDKRRMVSAGYNGFARGVKDTGVRLIDRDTKLKLTIHAEKNAILFATTSLVGATIVVTHPCCAQCAAVIIQSGIKHVMFPKPHADFLERWQADYDLASTQFIEAGVRMKII